jgi:hypothetical protein
MEGVAAETEYGAVIRVENEARFLVAVFGLEWWVLSWHAPVLIQCIPLASTR